MTHNQIPLPVCPVAGEEGPQMHTTGKKWKRGGCPLPPLMVLKSGSLETLTGPNASSGLLGSCRPAPGGCWEGLLVDCESHHPLPLVMLARAAGSSWLLTPGGPQLPTSGTGPVEVEGSPSPGCLLLPGTPSWKHCHGPRIAPGEGLPGKASERKAALETSPARLVSSHHAGEICLPITAQHLPLLHANPPPPAT